MEQHYSLLSHHDEYVLHTFSSTSISDLKPPHGTDILYDHSYTHQFIDEDIIDSSL